MRADESLCAITKCPPKSRMCVAMVSMVTVMVEPTKGALPLTATRTRSRFAMASMMIATVESMKAFVGRVVVSGKKLKRSAVTDLTTTVMDEWRRSVVAARARHSLATVAHPRP